MLIDLNTKKIKLEKLVDRYFTNINDGIKIILIIQFQIKKSGICSDYIFFLKVGESNEDHLHVFLTWREVKPNIQNNESITSYKHR